MPLDMNFNENNEEVNTETNEPNEEYVDVLDVEHLEEQEKPFLNCCSIAITELKEENFELSSIILKHEKKIKMLEEKIEELRNISTKHRKKNYYLEKSRKKLRETIEEMKENKLISQAISEELKV